MNTYITFILAAAVLLAPFVLVALLTRFSRRSGTLRRHIDQFRVAAPMVGRLFDERDPDARRLDHELDAIRTRFEEQPSWPKSGALGERR